MGGIIADSAIPLLYKEGSFSGAVTTVNDQTLDESIAGLLYDLTCSNRDLLEQVRLLNARFEEAFNSRINEGDL